MLLAFILGEGAYVIDTAKVVEVLKKHPQGLKAREIANYISGADRKCINGILYANPQIFACNDCYKWMLKDEYRKQQLKWAREREAERIAAIADLKEKLTTKYGEAWNSKYEKYSVEDCKRLLTSLMTRAAQSKKDINKEPVRQSFTLDAQIKNQIGPVVTFGTEFRGCSGTCSTCERTECVKYMSNKK